MSSVSKERCDDAVLTKWPASSAADVLKQETNGTIPLPALRKVGAKIFRLPRLCDITASKFSATFKPRNDGLIRVRCYLPHEEPRRLGDGAACVEGQRDTGVSIGNWVSALDTGKSEARREVARVR